MKWWTDCRDQLFPGFKTPRLWIAQQCRSFSPPPTSQRGRHIATLFLDSRRDWNKCTLRGGKSADQQNTWCFPWSPLGYYESLHSWFNYILFCWAKKKKNLAEQRRLELELHELQTKHNSSPSEDLRKEILVVKFALEGLLMKKAEKSIFFMRQRLYEFANKRNQYLAIPLCSVLMLWSFPWMPGKLLTG